MTNSENFDGSGPGISPQLLAEYWSRVRKRLQSEIGEATYTSWFKDIDLVGASGNCVTLCAPTPFLRTWIKTHYSERLQSLWEHEDPRLDVVEITVTSRDGTRRNGASSDNPSDISIKEAFSASHSSSEPSSVPETPSGFSASDSPKASVMSGFDEEFDGAPLDDRYTFDAFVVGKSNELAHSAARRVCEGTDVPFNPLYLHGKVGLGKTHLMHAIAHEIRQRHPSRKVMYLSAESFMYRFINALRYKNTMAFKEQFRSVDVLMIDDVQFIAGKNTTQEEFFHTFNTLVDRNRQVIISADRSPSSLDVEERLRSRLGWGLVADFHSTDYELRLGILQAKADEFTRHSGAVELPTAVLEFLAHRIVSNVRELEGALKRVVAYASYSGQPITIEMSENILQDLLRSNDRRVSIEDVQAQVAAYYQIKKSDLLSSRRTRQIARPRQVAMYLCKQLTTRSLPEIGRKFGNRDHTTVMHAVKRIEELCLADPTMEQDVERIRGRLANNISTD